MARNDLSEYKKKRKFNNTPEPKGGKKKSPKKGRIFVIQKHDATNLHYDLRLEIGESLASWAVPKGPSTDPDEKRLAMRTEDHPLEYADFEGVIPQGEYGAGPVIVWDKGTYKNMRQDKDKKEDRADMEKSLKEGKIEIWLKGKKLKGGYYLIRTSKQKGKERWLFMKADDGEADARRNPTNTQPKSVKSNKTIKEIKKEHEKNS